MDSPAPTPSPPESFVVPDEIMNLDSALEQVSPADFAGTFLGIVMTAVVFGFQIFMLVFIARIVLKGLFSPFSMGPPEQKAKLRKRKLVIEPKTEPKAEPKSTTKPSKVERHLDFMERSLSQARGQLDEVRAKFESYQNDIALALRAPLLSIETDSQVQDFVLELADLVSLRNYDYQLEDFKEPRDVPFIARTRKLAQTFKHLERRAKNQRPSTWGDKEAKLVEQAISLLAKAQDERNHTSERQLSYERVFKIMEELTIPRTPAMILAIESSGLTLELEGAVSGV